MRLLPVIVGIAVGVLLRGLKLLSHQEGQTIFKVVFYVFLPALIFLSLSTADLGSLALYPLAACGFILVGSLVGLLVTWRAGWDPIQAAIVICGCIAVNTGFTLPFIDVLYGTDGVARIAAFDAVNTTSTFTLSYYLAARANPHHHGGSLLLDRLVKSPALYAIAVGLLVNVTGLDLPSEMTEPLGRYAAATGGLFALGVGVLIDPIGEGFRKAALVAVTRLVSGMAVASAIVLLFDLSAMDRTIILLFGAAPLGFAVVTFAALENLDLHLATNALSLSLATGIGACLLVTLTSG